MAHESFEPSRLVHISILILHTAGGQN